VSEYAIDSSSGNLSPLPTPLVRVKELANQVLLAPSGKYAYVTNTGDDEMFQFSVDPTTGELSPLAQQATVPTSVGITDAIINPNTEFLYAVSDENNNILTYKINEQNGMLMQPIGIDNMLQTNDNDSDILEAIIARAKDCHYYCLVTSKLAIGNTTMSAK
jgi:DNA-binding beta-propeller fold protein YncE